MAATPASPAPPDTRPLLTIAEVAARLACSRRQVYLLIEAGTLVAIRVDERALRVAPADREAYLREQRPRHG